MVLIGIISVLQFFLALIATAVTGRKAWLAILFWCIPIYGLIYAVPKGAEINGLVVVISYYMVFVIIYSLWGVKFWHTGERKNKRAVIITFFSINFFICAYYVYQCVDLGYMGTDIAKISKASKTFASVIAGVILSALMMPSSITALDIFFSKKESFALIHCSPLRTSKKRGIYFKGKYAIKGIQNGKEYIFKMTRKAFLLLKQRESFVMEAKRGILGGVYVKGNLYKNENRRIARINRVLIRSGVFVFVLTIVVILFIVRVQLGISFESIFTKLWGEVLNWIK